MSFQAKNVILTNLLSNRDVARNNPKFDFLGKIWNIEANYKYMNQTSVISLLFGHMGRVFTLFKYLETLINVRFRLF